MNTTLISSKAQVYKQSQKITHTILNQYRYQLIIWDQFIPCMPDIYIYFNVLIFVLLMYFILTWTTYTSNIVFELQMVPQIIFYKYKYVKSH